MKILSDTLGEYKESIFATMTKLSNEKGALNLAQGFPGFDTQDWIKENAINAIKEGFNQYAPSSGLSSLREKLSQLYKQKYDLSYDPQNQILITNGATEGIYLTLKALLNPGDEVVVFEPVYDSYLDAISTSKAIAKAVTLRAPSFDFDFDQLEKAFSHKTKLIILNTPHNPTGKVFSLKELKKIQELVLKYDAYILADEVYEYLTFDEHIHQPIASLEGLKDRTLTISSISKTLGATGWKIGWVCSSQKLITALQSIHQYSAFSVATPLQEGVARSFDHFGPYLEKFKASYHKKRQILMDGLKECGFTPYKPEGTFFILAGFAERSKLDDQAYALELVEKNKVTTIPPSHFYLKSDEGKKMLRFCFAKEDEILHEAITRLKN